MWTFLFWQASPIRWWDVRFLSKFDKTSEMEVYYIGWAVKRISLEGVSSLLEGWMSFSD